MGYPTGVVYVIGGVSLLINRRARLAATWIGLFVLLLVILFNVPLMVQYGSDIVKGLNFPVDTLMLSGGMLCLAGSLRERSRTRAGTAGAGLKTSDPRALESLAN